MANVKNTVVSDETAWNIFHALDLLCKHSAVCSEKLRSFLAKQIWSELDRQTMLQTLTELFINPSCVREICIFFKPLMLDLVERVKQSVLKQGHSNARVKRKFAMALGLSLPSCPELERFATAFIKVHQPFTSLEDEEPKKKKARREKVSDLDWCRATYNFATHLRNVDKVISLRFVDPHLSHQDLLVRGYAALTVCKLLKLSGSQKDQFLRRHLTLEEEREFTLRCYQDNQQMKMVAAQGLGAVSLETSESAVTHTKHQLLQSDLSSAVVSITGVLLPHLASETPSQVQSHSLWVGVPSMLDSLHSLALAVSAGRPALIQGPVGCGKTSLVQHLAGLTGRHAAPHLIKVQLSDQTDSKALLGTYQCTEIPGQFVWQAGVLTEAVTRGHWVLLEDLDHAPMEVISTLTPLLQTSTLSVPGHGDIIHAAPGFQLFATQRLFASGDGLHSQNRNSAVLDKLWTRVTIQPLSCTELQQVVRTCFPQLSSVVGQLLDIYFLLSAGHHHLIPDLTPEGEGQSSEQQTVGKFLSLTGRLISTRDLMSWCSRISMDFDPSSPSSGAKVFQAALDCFVSCLSKPSKRLPLAEAIAAKLNITKDKAEYFLTKHKPSVELSPATFTVGRATLQCKPQDTISLSRAPSAMFSFTQPSVSLLEKVAVCVVRNEAVLLVGETGTGKTSTVQYLAQQLGHKLHVINLNQQSDSIDLLGGFKPVDLRFVIQPFREEFEMLFSQTFSRKQNARFLGHLQNCFFQKRWADLLALMEHCQQSAISKFPADTEDGQRWRKIGVRLLQLKLQIQETENVLAFSFIEGTLVKALRSGDWVLLDEINLAAAETLECLAGLLESTDGSLVLTERGDMDPVVRHPDFRLFACMNPATDVGKKDLTPGIRNRFTEFYVDELDRPADLKVLVGDYLRGLSLTPGQLDGIVAFYLEVRELAASQLVDGTGHKPHYSLRTLCRALRFSRSHNCGSIARSLYEGFCLSFLTQLDRASHPTVEKLICKHILSKTNVKAILKQPLPEPPGGGYLNFEGYWISCGTLEPSVPENYILTASVRANLKDMARVVSAGRHPVLLQGETSVGKTSLITWLARCSGNHCVRVNNHEHTDLQEYVGCYAADESGKLVFKEGVLVEAMRKGYWIILDELNLAPTDVLEALNRLLDDNQELFIPETQEMVKAHPKFMLFATQNPPGHYGGRKMLSRAFRNRFVELHFEEIPRLELETILHQRCHIPLSYAKRLVAVMADLQVQRQCSSVFAGKHCMMTLRDLFRWAERYNCPDAANSSKFYNWDQHLADHGFMLLAGRVRKIEEAAVIQTVIEKHMKCKVGPERLFDLTPDTSPTVVSILRVVTGQMDPSSSGVSSPLSSSCSCVEGFEHVVWTHSMRRLAVLIGQAVHFGEPVLLVGDTGCGKTTVCQLYAAMKNKNLHSVNCHLHTESADFLGGLRPVRSHHTDEDVKHQKLFEWLDGPLVMAMKTGSMFLIDEISLADDSVLERLNSVLEPERCILLAEKGGGDGSEDEVEIVRAVEGFQVFATMNPGGDFGKKELSPALRNRFTEIWCPQSNSRKDLVSIIEHNIHPGISFSNTQSGKSGFGVAIMDFIAWFSNNEIGKRCTVSIRDILSWVQFINTCTRCEGEGHMSGGLDPSAAYIHGACLVFLDSLGAGVTSRGIDFDAKLARTTCLTFLQQQVKAITGHDLTLETIGLQTGHPGEGQNSLAVELMPDSLTIFPFSIARETGNKEKSEQYAIQAPTTCLNAQRILRGLQLPRPLLLEGAPGVGKTSLVAAVARLASSELVRINLSEQTDVTDLFGADLPVEGATGGSFAWRDGPFLQALKAGHWVVFDELNLASQSVLEGLNACLDHRGEVFIPELGRTFRIQHGRTRIFACQNPLNQGGGRKGLPRSFLNRFTQVYVEPLLKDDLIFICSTMYPSIPRDMLTKMVDFNMKMYEETMVSCSWGRKGAPWEFNLRDINRWCDLLLANQAVDKFDPSEYVYLVYQDRMRTSADKSRVTDIFKQVFGTDSPFYQPSRIVRVTPSHFQAGNAFLRRESGQGVCSVGRDGDGDGGVLLLHHSLGALESLMTCVNMGWMAILVGPASSGKSSLVQLMAELTGHPLSVLPMSTGMDTMELLGGFEQADIGRHIAELMTEVAREVREFQCHCLAEGDATAQGLAVSLDEELLQLKTEILTETSVESGEENVALKSQVKHLKRLVQKLSKLQTNSEHLKRLSSALEEEEQLLKKVSPGASGVGGGTFEWVDSLLVKALHSGEWLLIDNVNFCSPSVLDRLNALLEPRGVLSINERGVTNGSVPTITPHPNFRLFLSMDPRQGEISRAMRNRGVEIYVLGEEDGCPFSHHDTLSMLKGVGLDNQLACDWLMQLHALLRDKLPTNEQPGICDLLRAGMMVKQQLEKGDSMESALKHAVENVYIRRIRSVLARKGVREVVAQQREQLRSNKTVDGDILDRQVEWALVAPSVEQFQNCGLTASQQAARVFVTLQTQPEKLGFLTSETCTSADSYLHSVQSALSIFTSLQSKDTWKLAVDWLKMHISQGKGITWKGISDFPPEDQQKLQTRLDGLMHMTESSLEMLFSSQMWRELKDTAQKMCARCSQAAELIKEQPWDLATNPQAVTHLTTLLLRHLPDHTHSRIHDWMRNLMATVKRLQMMHMAAVITEEMKPGLEQLAELSRKVSRQKSKSSLVLNHLCQLLTCLQSHLPGMVSVAPASSVEHLHQRQEKMLWLLRLLDEGLTSRRGQVEEVFLSQLSLHWNWCWHKVLTHLVTPVSEPTLFSAVNQLNTLLGESDAAAKLFVKFWLAWGHPRAFPTEKEAKLWQELQAVSDILSVYCPLPTEALRPKVKVMTSHGKVIRHRMVCVAQKLLAGDCGVEEDLRALKEILATHGLWNLGTSRRDVVNSDMKSMVTLDSSDRCELSETQIHCFVQLWPLYEHLGLLAELSHLLHSPGKEGEEMERRALMRDFILTFTPAVDSSALSKEQNLSDGEQMKCLLLLLQRLWSSLAVNGSCRWLTWGCAKDAADAKKPSQDTTGPAVFHRSAMLFYASHLLSTSQIGSGLRDHVSGHHDLLPLNVTLGGVDRELSQLDAFARYLWRHAGVLGDPCLSLGFLEQELLVQTFLSMLTALTPVMDTSVHSEWTDIINSLHSISRGENHNHSPSKESQLSAWQKNQSSVEPLLAQIHDLIRDHCCWMKEGPVVNILSQCVGAVRKLVCSSAGDSDVGSDSGAVGRALVYVGLALSHLLAPCGPVDPVQKAAIKLKHFQQELVDTEIELDVWEAHLQLTTGQGITDTDPKFHHPHLAFLLQRRSQLQREIALLEQGHAFRGDSTKYLRLCQEVSSFLQTVASPPVVESLISRLLAVDQADSVCLQTISSVANAALQEERTWQATTQRLSQRLGSEYPYLPDLTMPLCLAVELMRLGMRGLAQEAMLRLKQSQIHRLLGNRMLESVVTDLCAFPSIRSSAPTLLHLATRLSSGMTGEVVRFLSHGAGNSDEVMTSHDTQSRLLMCSLLLLKTHAQQTQELTPDLIMTLTHILDLFVLAWREQEEQRHQKEEEEAALFHFKEKSHGDARTEAEREEAHFRESFPSYHEDFRDMVEATRLEDTGKREQPMEEDDDRVVAPDAISEEEMDEVCRCHIQLLHKLTSADWLPRQPVPTATSVLGGWDVLRPVLLGYQMAGDIARQSWDLLRESVDQQTFGSHLLVCGSAGQSVQAVLENSGSATTFSLHPSSPKCYNIYTDPNVPEVIQCRPILHQVVTRATELQQEWPQHPTLKQLCEIVARIESFPVTSPVIKFLTGLELLLQTAQHWESNASSRVSMATQLAEVTAVIVRWRQLELSCWSGSLDIEVERSQQKASRWWFHLYNLTSSFLSQSEQDKLEIGELLKSLKQFLESSTMGEYSARLDILLAFHCQLVNTEPSEQRDVLLCVLWNGHQFYSQFQGVVDSEIGRLRAPIEKELKGFVKIARWSDMNYWALKESTEKTHRTVHKHIRAFQAVLNQPVKSLLGEKPSDHRMVNTEDTSGIYSEQVIRFYHYALTQSQAQVHTVECEGMQPVLAHLPACTLQQKLPVLCSRAARHWRGVLTTSNTCQDISSLDDLTGQLIEEVHELQKLDVTQGPDKEKQRAEARHINLHKRKALADLFKQLTGLGLSYRKGLSKEKTNHVDNALRLQPLDPSASLDKGHRLVDLWEGCDVYFTRCLSRLTLLSAALQSPSRELGPANVERCHGFAEHLTTIYLTQRQELTDVYAHFSTLRRQLAALKAVSESSKHLLPQSQAKHWLVRAKEQTTQVIQGLTQFSILLQACPTAQSGSSPTGNLSPFPSRDLSPMSLMQHGDQLWMQCFDKTQKFLETTKKVQMQLLPVSDRVLITSSDMDTISSALTDLASVGHGLQDMVQSLSLHSVDSDLDDLSNNSCLTSTIAFLSSSSISACKDFVSWKDSLVTPGPHTDVEMNNDVSEIGSLSQPSGVEASLLTPEGAEVMKFAESTESLVEVTLLSIQGLVKYQKEQTQKMKEDGKTKEEEERKEEGKEREKEEENVEGLKENHLIVITESLQQHTVALQCGQLVGCLQDALSTLKQMTDCVSSSANTESSSDQSAWRVSVCAGLLIQCRPLLDVYLCMVEMLVAQALALHRTLGKMLSVLLAVFTELAQKGFCMPAEYSDKAAGEGATDFVDIEGGGIGEGEGSKDVSDQIETEDQLDEARRPEDQKEEDDQPQRDLPSEDNAIEMSEDFDAKLQDLEPVEGDDDEGNDEKEEEDIEKQMGEVDGPDSDRLDEQMWGSDEEEESRDQEKDNGPGTSQQGESELVAKDDLKNSTDADEQGEEEEKKKQDEKNKDEEQQKPHELDEFDESEYNDNKTDPYHGDQKQQEEPENLDLPDDLNLDQDEKGEEAEAGADGEAPPDQPDDTTMPDMTEEVEQEPQMEDKESVEEAGENEEEKTQKEEERKEEDADGNDHGDGSDDMNENEGNEEKEDEDTDTKPDTADDKRKENEGEGDKGFNPQDKESQAGEQTEEGEKGEKPEGVEERGKTTHDALCAVQSDTAQDKTAGQSEQKEREGVGTATPDQQEGHEGMTSNKVTEGTSGQERQQMHRRPGQSKSERSLGSANEKFRLLKTTDSSTHRPQTEEEKEDVHEADLYEHITDDTSCADAQTLDAATDEQQQKQQIVAKPEDENVEDGVDDDDDVQMADEKEKTDEKVDEKSAGHLAQPKPETKETNAADDAQDGDAMEVGKTQIPGSKVLTLGAERPPESTIHTQLEHFHLDSFGASVDIDALRSQLEDSMKLWAHPDATDHHKSMVAVEAWQKYETLMAGLSQELCEQLRLILEPSQATKLKGDYRTGKRLNMRKVIPYIASQFRKDKIWLRRTKPSKRQYQIMLAIDDSSSMADNHSKQLAFESLALTANALTLLETGELAVCSFGETVKLLHPFTEPFSNQAGARILQQFTFEQKKTRIAQLLQQATAVMLESRGRQQGSFGRAETAQLVLIVSDGRGMFAEGRDIVRTAVRQAREANIFLVFIVLDEPTNKDSILDIKVPVFKPGGQLPEIRSYMEDFPFPFYVILRDINSLPRILSDALRQWFELVTAAT